MKEGMRFWLTNDELNFQARLREACYHLIRDAWKQLWNHSDEDREWHHKKFVHWMGQLIKSADNGELEPGSQIWEKRSDESKELLFQSVSAENVAGELPVKVGRRLIDIIQGHITPLDLMMEDGLLHKHYEAVLETGWLRCLRTQFRQLMQNFIVKHPGARVLEIGAGTGSATRYALEALADTNTHGGCLLAQYDFTDISSGFFEAAKVKFAAYERLMTYSRLDIEADPVEQGFATGSYDLIVAAEVLHATTNLTRTLTNVRSLLKPGGKLMLVESTRGRLDTQLAFGVLPGWWLSEEPYRKDAPVVSVERWNDLLQATGFSGVDFDIGACENVEVNYSSLMLSTATTGPGRFPHVSIVYKRSDNDAIWLQPLADAMSNELGVETALETFEGLSVRPDRLCIMALDIKDSIFQNLTSTDFENLQAVLVNSPNILWLSFGGLVSAEKPQFAQVQGLLRALRREDVAKRCFHLDFDQSSDQDSETIIRNVVHVVRTGFNFEVSQGQMDCEYAVKDGVLHVPRLYPDFKQDQACESDVQTIKVRMPFQTDRTLVWQASDDGLVENAHFVPRPLPNEDGFCSDGVVEIEAKAFGLNFRDVLISMGMLVPANEDHEAAGIVTRLGRGTEQSGLQIGDRVCGNFNGLLANKSQAPWTSVCKIPPEMSYQEAASIPSAFGTAYYSLVTVAGLKPSESVLIHSAAGGVGQAAVMLARDIGAEVFVTCGGPEKKKLLMDRYKIPGDHIFSSRDESFAPALMAATANKGVDVALNSLAGPLLKATWECMARFGRFVEIGKMDIAASRWLDMSLFRRGLSFTAVDLSQTNVYSPEIMHEVLIACVDLCQRGCVRPVHPITTFSISNIDKAITHMRQGQHMGKLVIVPEEHAEVNVVSKTVPLELSNMSGTIIVVGGLTGVGKAISEWLISRGARNLAIVSRNATSHAHANELLQRAAQHECDLRLYDCDISDETAFLEMRDNIRTNMPSIIGVIQGAMVLNVCYHGSFNQNEGQN
jgi:NADPH:quinone reductase-like Zn-dependent oxidoreductase/SAM-dependent methyltransferase